MLVILGSGSECRLADVAQLDIQQTFVNITFGNLDLELRRISSLFLFWNPLSLSTWHALNNTNLDFLMWYLAKCISVSAQILEERKMSCCLSEPGN